MLFKNTKTGVIIDVPSVINGDWELIIKKGKETKEDKNKETKEDKNK